MNSTVIKRTLILTASLITSAAMSNAVYSADTPSSVATYKKVADADTTDRYALPPTKANIKPCRQESLRLHPGVIENQRILHRRGEVLIRFQIQARDDSEWFTLCDLATGKIIEEF